MQTDQDKYPNMPGWKGNKSTGRNAAFAIAQTVTGRRRQVYEAIQPYGPSGATCDDISEALGLPPYLIRPRATELEKLGKLYALPDKRLGQMGHKVSVYSTIKPAEQDEAV